MPLDDILHAPASPDALNAYYLKTAPMTELLIAKDQLTTDGRIYNNMYAGKVKSYDPAGKSMQRRSVRLETRRSNQRYSNDWENWKRGCGPQEWTTKTLGRPGASETWSYVQHLSYDTPAYNLKQIVAEALDLPAQLEQDMIYRENVRRDIYDEYYRNFHLTMSERHWMAWKDAAGKFHFDDKIGGGSFEQPWRFARDTDGCLSNMDKIFVSDNATNSILKLSFLTPKAVRQITRTYAANDPSGAYKKVTLITSDIAPEQIMSSDDYFMDTLKRRDLGPGATDAIVFHALSQQRQIGSLMDFKVDQQIPRYRSTGVTNDAGEFELERVNQYIDIQTNSDMGVRTIENPDWQNPLVAAYELYVVANETVFTPYRPNWPEVLAGNMQFGPSNFARWEWFNIANMEYNRRRETGFFGLEDDLMAVSKPEARSASVILVRRMHEDYGLEDIAGTLVAPQYTSAEPETTCADVQFKCAPPSCTPTQPGFGYAFGDESPSCPNCL